MSSSPYEDPRQCSDFSLVNCGARNTLPLYIFGKPISAVKKKQLTKSSWVAGLPLCTVHSVMPTSVLKRSNWQILDLLGGEYTPSKLRNPMPLLQKRPPYGGVVTPILYDKESHIWTP
jgi:hypothetical protein